jgi:adenine-specific DNA-methyltransferase
MPTIQQQRDKLIGLLKELFQLDQPDLDFGFYRIMHAREVTAFLEEDLLKTVEEKFGQGNAASIAQLQKAYDDAVAQAKSFGAADPEQTEPVKRAKAALAAAKDTSRAEGEVYDHLYRFFERYYDAGDFMSRRYLSRETSSKAAAYAVPYDGSEVYLHWANKDQYYIKTAEYFTNFTFDPAQAPEVRQAEGLFTAPNQPLRVHFRIVAATEGEHGNIKAGNGAKRFFILHKDDPISVESGDLVVRFEYRPDPEKSGQDKTWQAKRNEEAVAGILEVLGVLNDARAKEYLAILKTPAPTEKRADRPLLAKYIAQYTARNTMDYFIHKDLGGFLRRELDFYIKNEVMRLDDIEAADAPKAEQYLAQVKVLRQIADKLIDFLAQLENFQKRLWLKKKFIVETNYCVTLDRVPEELYPDIAANDAQREEWVRLFAIDEIKVETLGQVAYSEPLTVGFLKANPHLVLDTKLFPETFKITLLAVVEDIDEQTDGILASSENFQALALLGAEYQSRVQCAYSDPPYNTSDETFVYKNEYKHSSWLSMLRDRLFLVRRLLEDKGAAIVAIDDMELYRLKLTMDEVFGENNGLGTVVVQSNPRGRGINSYFATCHDYYLYYGDEAGLVQIVDQPLSDEQAGGYRHADDTSEFRLLPFRRSGGLSTPDERPNSEFSIYYSRTKRQIIGVGGPRTEAYPAAYRPGSVLVRTESDTIKELSVKDFEKVTAGDDVAEIMPVDSDGRRRVWRWSHREKIMACVIAGDFVVIQNGSEYTVQLKDRIKEGRKPKTIWSDSKYDASSHGTNLLSDMLGERRSFGYPKSLFSTHDAVHAIVGASERALVLDPFGGSGTTGHAVINLNREDDGNRRYILVEMGDYFDTVLKPRIQKVVYSKDWKDGKPVSRDSGISHMFKYIRLESYEDCLNNLELKDDAERERIVAGSASLREDYMLHYMLDVETKGSVSLLNIDKFADPTAYKLKVKKPGSDEYEWKNVDLLETFNYLVGLRVEHIAAPQAFRAEFDREKDPDLPKGQLGRLMVKGRLKQDPNGPWWFRKVEGWVPKNPQTPNDGRREKVLIVWRKLTGDIEQDNLVLDEWFRKYQINPRESYDYDTIYVNGSNNLPNLKLENENWRVRLIEEDFHRLMWDVEDV